MASETAYCPDCDPRRIMYHRITGVEPDDNLLKLKKEGPTHEIYLIVVNGRPHSFTFSTRSYGMQIPIKNLEKLVGGRIALIVDSNKPVADDKIPPSFMENCEADPLYEAWVNICEKSSGSRRKSYLLNEGYKQRRSTSKIIFTDQGVYVLRNGSDGPIIEEALLATEVISPKYYKREVSNYFERLREGGVILPSDSFFPSTRQALSLL